MKPVNLLRSSLDATVTCDKCTVDGYTVANLISEDIVQRQKGALLEHFIRPPVDIDFTLPCPSDVGLIKIKLSRASTIVQRLQVWTQSSGQDHWAKLTTAASDVGGGGGELILKCGQILPPYLNMDSMLGQSVPQVVRMLRSAVKLRVTILAMKNCVAVGLAGCEAFGVPSRHLPRVHPIFSKLNEKLRHASDVQQSASTGVASNHRVNENRLRNKPEKGDILRNSARKRQLHEITSSSSAEATPEEFLDAITIAIMSIPVILPSGNIVDQSTLDKYVANENRWGRPASDPFTGVPLRARPPVLTELKSRIDHFLSNSGSTSGVRVADGRNVSRPEISRLISVPSTPPPPLPPTAAATARDGPVLTKSTSHNEARPNVTLSTDLTTAFAQALATARMVLNRGSEGSQECGGTSSKRTKSVCANCDSIEATYKLTCEHLLCRSCVIVETTAKCRTCGTESLRAEIVKINLL